VLEPSLCTGPFGYKDTGALRLNVNDARPLELGVLKLAVTRVDRVVPIPGVSTRIGDDAAAPNSIVKRVVAVPVASDVSLLQERHQVTDERGGRRSESGAKKRRGTLNGCQRRG